MAENGLKYKVNWSVGAAFAFTFQLLQIQIYCHAGEPQFAEFTRGIWFVIPP